MKETFVGGKGFDLWLLWNAVNGNTRWDSPENALCIACGPLGGTPIYPGSGKSIVTAISPTTGSVMDSNVGGFFGPYLKFSGFDALEIQGKTERAHRHLYRRHQQADPDLGSDGSPGRGP